MRELKQSPHYTKESKNAPYVWNPQSIQTIKQMFNEGIGPDSIAIRLKVPGVALRHLLTSLGLKRSREEAIKARFKS